MQINELIKYLKCEKCDQPLSISTSDKENRLSCKKCSKSIDVSSNSVFFSDINPDIRPTIMDNPCDKEKWSKWRAMNYSYFSSVLDNLSLSTESLVMDIGAGNRPFRDLLDNFSLISVDFYPYPEIDICCDISKKLPIQSNIADCIILSNVLEHMNEPELTLKECHRILKSGGVLIVTVPFIIKIHQSPHDYYRYTKFGLQYLLDKVEFSEVSISEIGTFSDVFELFNHSYWKNMSYKFSKTGFIRRNIFRIVKKIDSIITKIKVNALDKIILSDKCLQDKSADTPQGYGFIARK